MRASRSERPLTLRHSLDSARNALRDHGISEWRIEADVILSHVVGVSRADMLSLVYGGERSLTRSQALLLHELITRRVDGKPLAYIVGRREFYGLDFDVNESVLIPRQETELLVEVALEYLTHRDAGLGQPTVVDVGTGSGAVALALAAHTQNARIVGVDMSRAALEVAARNRDRLRAARVEFVQCDMLTAIAGAVDVIVSNPPYIPTSMLGSLAVEVRREPVVALDGGADGLDHFRRLAAQAIGILTPGGVMIVELMPEQMDAAAEIARRSMPNTSALRVENDLMGNRRALVAEIGAPHERA